MAAAYFFFVKPAADTTTHAIDSIAEPIKEATKEAHQAQEQLQQQAQTDQSQGNNQSATNTQVQINKLQRCVRKAGQNVNALQNCANKYAP
jgi:F0F1-type ATP synthase membrane subunit b/b'